MNFGGETYGLGDNPWIGRPETATTDESLPQDDSIYYMAMDEKRLAINQIVDSSSISHERVQNILQNMTKVSTWLMPRLLKPDQNGQGDHITSRSDIV